MDTLPGYCLFASDRRISFMVGNGRARLSVNQRWRTNTWHLLHGRIDRTNGRLALALDGRFCDPEPAVPGSYDNRELFMVGANRGPHRKILHHFSGRADEIRLIKAALSDAWCLTEYRNQASPSTFYSVGPEETR
jgi:hypothetical protein